MTLTDENVMSSTYIYIIYLFILYLFHNKLIIGVDRFVHAMLICEYRV